MLENCWLIFLILSLDIHVKIIYWITPTGSHWKGFLWLKIDNSHTEKHMVYKKIYDFVQHLIKSEAGSFRWCKILQFALWIGVIDIWNPKLEVYEIIVKCLGLNLACFYFLDSLILTNKVKTFWYTMCVSNNFLAFPNYMNWNENSANWK